MRELLLNEEIYSRVVEELMAEAQRFLWIVTADIKGSNGFILVID